MNIWQITFEADLFDMLRPEENWSPDEVQQFNGKKVSSQWTPIKLVRLQPEKGRPLSDAPSYYSHLPVLSERAKTVLENCFTGVAEVLPAINDEGEFWIINVTNVLDCVDYANAGVTRFRSGRVMLFEKYAFLKDKVKQQHVFKIVEEPLRYLFVSDDFKKTVEENQLTGFCFNLACTV